MQGVILRTSGNRTDVKANGRTWWYDFAALRLGSTTSTTGPGSAEPWAELDSLTPGEAMRRLKVEFLDSLSQLWDKKEGKVKDDLKPHTLYYARVQPGEKVGMRNRL